LQALNTETGFTVAGARAVPTAPVEGIEEPISTESGSGLFALFAD